MALRTDIGINLFGRLDPLEGLRHIARAGYGAIDYSAVGRQITPGSPPAAALGALAAELRLLPAALHYRSFGFAFLADAETRRRFQETASVDVRLAAELGAAAIAFHLGNDLPATGDAALADANAAALAPVVRVAADEGVAIALENHCHGWGDRFEHLALVADYLASPQVGFCLDSGHAAVAGIDPAALAEQMGPRLRLVHLHSNDGHGDTHRPLDEGVVRVQPLLASLEHAGYAGTLLLEGGLHLPGDDVDALLVAHLRGARAALDEYRRSPA